MPKTPHKVGIKLDLFKPQSNPEKLPVRLVKWLLSTGRFILIFVEALVFIAFIARFKIDADLESKRQAIDQQIPFIKSMKPYETLIKQTQSKLSTIAAFRQSNADYPQLLKEIADQTPMGVKITSITMNKKVDRISVQMNGQAQTNNDLAAFVIGLKGDKNFSSVNLSGVGIELGALHFVVSLESRLKLANEQNSLPDKNL